MEESIDITFVNENENVLQSSLHYYLRLLEERKLTSLVIINDFTISFVGKENDFIVMSLPWRVWSPFRTYKITRS